MSDKEKLLIAIIIVILSAVISYRIDFVDDKLSELELIIDQLNINKGK